MLLGKLMTSSFDPPKDGSDSEESGIPALYTYFGQFIDHDITFDPMTTLIKHSDPDAITDFRTPALDLDNVYGRGPADQPYMYDPTGVKFLLGDKLDNGALDLPRNTATPGAGAHRRPAQRRKQHRLPVAVLDVACAQSGCGRAPIAQLSRTAAHCSLALPVGGGPRLPAQNRGQRGTRGTTVGREV